MTETSEFPAFMGRLLRAWADRVGQADTYDLAELVTFRDEVDAAIDRAIQNGRRQTTPWSWADIGGALKMSRQAAQQRWGRTPAASTPHHGDDMRSRTTMVAGAGR